MRKDISNHAPLAGRDGKTAHACRILTNFNPRAPCGARQSSYAYRRRFYYFNPRAPCGARRIGTGFSIAIFDFNPRAPCGARLCWWSALASRSSNFNPRAPCGARPVVAVPPVVDQNFNPRAPCGARRASFSRRLRAYLFQPTRPLRGATILGLGPGPSSSRRFQPTRPLRGATVLCGGDGQWLNYFNPRAPCGARREILPRLRRVHEISTHAPLAGRDGVLYPDSASYDCISTHAPLAGRDFVVL